MGLYRIRANFFSFGWIRRCFALIEDAYKEFIKTAVGGAAGVIHAVDCATTDCQPNENVEALRVFMLAKKIECRPVWKPMHKQPVYAGATAYTNDVETALFKIAGAGRLFPKMRIKFFVILF